MGDQHAAAHLNNGWILPEREDGCSQWRQSNNDGILRERKDALTVSQSGPGTGAGNILP
jgi:hypothetical protein